MDLKQVLVFLRQHRIAVQASVSATQCPQAAIVGVTVTDDLEIIFDTLQSTRKAQNLRRNAKVALVIGGWNPGDERTVQYEGTADEPSAAELERIKAAYYDVYPDGPSRLTWAGLTYVRVRPSWIRYSDYNVDPPRIVEFGPEEFGRTRATSR
jgi:general stress protein 26